ncbi:hypothetical protein BH160DRAFT_0831 [Burkholderia sp. H160]|nr:hypothetical protein BH160DRAFT_0831 [Burkholderia sp. H160]
MRRIERFVWMLLALAVCWILGMSGREPHRSFYESLFNAQYDARDYVVELHRADWRPNDMRAVGNNVRVSGSMSADGDVANRLPFDRVDADEACNPSQNGAETSATKAER